MKVWQAENEGDLIEFRPYVDPESKDAPRMPLLTVKTALKTAFEDDDREEMKVDDGTSSKGLLLVHQMSWQRRPLNR